MATAWESSKAEGLAEKSSPIMMMIRSFARTAVKESRLLSSGSRISQYEGMTDFMSLSQMQLIREFFGEPLSIRRGGMPLSRACYMELKTCGLSGDRLAADKCGVGTCVSAETFLSASLCPFRLGEDPSQIESSLDFGTVRTSRVVGSST